MTALYLSSTLRAIEARFQTQRAPNRLIQRAGMAAANWADTLLGHASAPIIVLAGPGNNGADGLVAATVLHEKGRQVHVLLDPQCAHVRSPLLPAMAFHGNLDSLPAPGLIIDALFGIGLSRPIVLPYAAWIDWANRQACARLALDVPSGLNADTGQPLGNSVFRATHTLSFLGLKPGLVTADGPDYAGQVRVDTLGIEAQSDGQAITADTTDVLCRAFRRPGNAHKGLYGTVGILGGDAGMVGAAVLAARAALKLGAGRVMLGFIQAPAPAYDPIQPELMLSTASRLLSETTPATVLAVGPGLGCSQEALEVLEQSLAMPIPLVLDADALNLIASTPALASILGKRTAQASILTPHPLEAARLLGWHTERIQQDRIHAACAIAERFGSTVVLKGQGTVIADPAGRWYINTSGNAGLSSGGTGDVLTGMITALLAQHPDTHCAVALATWLHGAAADCLVQEGTGPIGLAASELIDGARRLFNARLDKC